MTDPDNELELDELIAAYVDGEATAAERELIRADPALIARAEAFRATSALVAESVPQPDAGLRDQHIEAALAASNTAANVTALPGRTRSDGIMRIASIAAVVLAVMLAVPLLFLDRGDDADDAATSAVSADDGLAAMDEVAATGQDGAAEMEADESSPRSIDDADADTAATDTAEESAALPEAAVAEEAAEMADDAFVGDPFIGVVRIDLGRVGTTNRLRRLVETRLGESDPSGDTTDGATADELVCAADVAATQDLGGAILAVGTTVFDGVISEYLVIDDVTPRVVVVQLDGCRTIAVG